MASKSKAGLILLSPSQCGLCWEVLHWALWNCLPFLLSVLGLIRPLPSPALALACAEWAPLGIHGRVHALAETSQEQSGGDRSDQQGAQFIKFTEPLLCDELAFCGGQAVYWRLSTSHRCTGTSGQVLLPARKEGDTHWEQGSELWTKSCAQSSYFPCNSLSRSHSL